MSETNYCLLCKLATNSIFSGKIYKTKCGHIFHSSCLKKWIYYQQPDCPACHQTDIYSPHFIREAYSICVTC